MGSKRSWAASRLGVWLATVALSSWSAALGCQAHVVFPCQQDSDCVQPGGNAGVCEGAVGYCSYPNSDCPSQKRYSDHAGGGLAGTCTPIEEPAPVPTVASGADDPSESTTGSDTATVSATSETDPFDSSSGTTDDAPADTDVGACSWEELEFAAALAECTDPVNLDPQMCESIAGSGHIMVDTAAGQLDMLPISSYLVFEFDAPLDGVEAAWVELTASPDSSSESSGELWEVVPFTYDDLFDAQPAMVGNAPVSPDQGYVPGGGRARFDLSPSFVENSTVLHLGLAPISSDGLRYENLRSDPERFPKLFVERCR